MSKKIVRSVKNVTNIDQFSKNVLEENDIVSTQDGKVYVVSKNGFVELGGSGNDNLKQEITTLKSENTKVKNRVETLETENTNLKSSVETLETDVSTNKSDVDTLKTNVSTLQGQATDFENRIKALETPTPEE